MKFAKVAFPDAYIPRNALDSLKNNIGEKPTLIVTDGNPLFEDDARDVRDVAIKEIIEAFRSDTHNIAILVPFKASVENYHNLLDEMEIEHSMYYEDSRKYPNGCPEIDNVHITTFKSAKGLEFDTVIIPDFGSMDYLCNKFEVLEWNDFYVAVTRARSNLYLFSNYDMSELDSVVERNTTDLY
jgi:superfamily I DNA/RNA helicase